MAGWYRRRAELARVGGEASLRGFWKPIGQPLPSCDDASVSQTEDICSFSCVRGAALS